MTSFFRQSIFFKSLLASSPTRNNGKGIESFNFTFPLATALYTTLSFVEYIRIDFFPGLMYTQLRYGTDESRAADSLPQAIKPFNVSSRSSDARLFSISVFPYPGTSFVLINVAFLFP